MQASLRTATTACLMVIALVGRIPVSAQPHYNEQLLQNYIRLTQQLRREIMGFTQMIGPKIVALDQTYDSIKDSVQEEASKARDRTVYPNTRWQALTSTYGEKPCEALLIHKDPTYTSSSDPIFTDLRLSFGGTFNPLTSSVYISRDGVYMIEKTFLLSDTNYASDTIYVYSPEGGLEKQMNVPYVFSSAEVVVTLKLRAGSVVKFGSLEGYLSYYGVPPPNFLSSVIGANQVKVRFLGHFDFSAPQTTTNANTPEPTTSNWWFG